MQVKKQYSKINTYSFNFNELGFIFFSFNSGDDVLLRGLFGGAQSGGRNGEEVRRRSFFKPPNLDMNCSVGVLSKNNDA